MAGCSASMAVCSSSMAVCSVWLLKWDARTTNAHHTHHAHIARAMHHAHIARAPKVTVKDVSAQHASECEDIRTKDEVLLTYCIVLLFDGGLHRITL